MTVLKSLCCLFAFTSLFSARANAAIIVDDSQWNTNALQLSDGWNMARPTQIEMLNETEVERMQEFGLQNFFNSSISWTRTERAWNIITFRGSTIEIFGVRSPDSGHLTVEIDEEEVVSINAYSDRFITNSSIFKTTDLGAETTHSLRLINGNGLMYFDYAVVGNQSVSSTTSSKPSPTGLIVASGVETSRKSTTSVTPGEAMMNMGLDPAKVALLAVTPHFEWNWRVYFTIAFTAFMAIVAIILILMQYRRDQKLKSRISRSFFNSAPVAVQKIKGFKPNRKSALGKPRTYPTDLEAGDIVRRPLQSDPSPMRARSASLDSISGMPRAARQITLAEALKEERSAGSHTGQAL
ncbi:hypothetical protein HD553DRAFT_362580 [Filobasidium floriforme]|uniref:uncharacterized protein n=1 Tax=Filobasidium floriforme TaxID=5210 RepID=UPI001E8D2765|nr:uncharacterized protein HD553DRAFT_362580 [Filobasidium floriforme]KAH8079935.1 hypothetical protein HD553DRAFT_362580 [Filobasidium floriforme]